MTKQNTYATKASDIKRAWHQVDAKGRVLGRVATEVASLLRGKTKPYFAPYLDCGDYVVVTNAGKIMVTGGKEEKKMYYRHSGYIGNLKQEVFSKLLKRKPTEALKQAVHGMLPKNKLRKTMMARLKLYAGEDHPHQAQLAGHKSEIQISKSETNSNVLNSNAPSKNR